MSISEGVVYTFVYYLGCMVSIWLQHVHYSGYPIKSVRGSECDEEFEPRRFPPIIEGSLHLNLKLPTHNLSFVLFYLIVHFNSDVSRRICVFVASWAQFRLKPSP